MQDLESEKERELQVNVGINNVGYNKSIMLGTMAPKWYMQSMCTCYETGMHYEFLCAYCTQGNNKPVAVSEAMEG